jgi:hypothetical protein
MSENKRKVEVKIGTGATIGFGSVLAVTISWPANHAIGWAVIHGVLGWLYVIYYLFKHDGWTWF